MASRPEDPVRYGLHLLLPDGLVQCNQGGMGREDQTKQIYLSHTVESESFAMSEERLFLHAGLLAGIIEGSFGIRVQAKEVKCKSKGDEHCVFTNHQQNPNKPILNSTLHNFIHTS